MPYLIRKIGDPRDLSTEAVPISKQTFTIGRLKECDCVLEHPGVSRLHATVRLDGDKTFLSDQTSRNGTYVNHVRLLGEQQLLDGDLVQICDHNLIYRDTLPAEATSHGVDPKKVADPAVIPSTVQYPKKTQGE